MATQMMNTNLEDVAWCDSESPTTKTCLKFKYECPLISAQEIKIQGMNPETVHNGYIHMNPNWK